jgi:hypothetical protein
MKCRPIRVAGSERNGRTHYNIGNIAKDIWRVNLLLKCSAWVILQIPGNPSRSDQEPVQLDTWMNSLSRTTSFFESFILDISVIEEGCLCPSNANVMLTTTSGRLAPWSLRRSPRGHLKSQHRVYLCRNIERPMHLNSPSKNSERVRKIEMFYSILEFSKKQNTKIHPASDGGLPVHENATKRRQQPRITYDSIISAGKMR